METIVVKLLASLVTSSICWAVAACCERFPGVLSAPPLTISEWAPLV